MVETSKRTYPSRIRVGVAPRDKGLFPVEGEALGEALYRRLEKAIAEGRLPRPAVLAFMEDQITQYDVLPMVRAGADLHRFVSSVAGQEGVEAVASVALVRLGPRSTKRVQKLAGMCFVEWPDSRWWGALRLLDDKKIREDWPVSIRCAEDGDPRPGGVGAWFSRARRENLRLNMTLDRPEKAPKWLH